MNPLPPDRRWTGASLAASVISTTALSCCCFYYPKFKAKKLSPTKIGSLLEITTPVADSGFKARLSSSQRHLSPHACAPVPSPDKVPFLTPSKTRRCKYGCSCGEHLAAHQMTKISLAQVWTVWTVWMAVVINMGY